MKIRALTFLTILLALAFTFSSCGGSDDPGGCADNWNFANELSNEAQALSNAATAYGLDPTPENCQAFKDAYQAYLDAARDLEGCAQSAGQLDEYNQAIDEAEAELQQLQC